MAEGALDKVMNAVGSMGSKIATAPDSEAAGIRARQTNIDDYVKSVTKKPDPLAAEPVVSDRDKLHPNSKFGDNPGEKRIDVSSMTKPLASYKKGTTRVAKTGPAILHKNEAVVPSEKNPMSPDYQGAVMDMAKDKKPKKVLDHMRIRKAKTGGHIVEHHHTHPDHKMEEHLMPDMQSMHDHMDANAPAMGEEPEAGAAPAGQ